MGTTLHLLLTIARCRSYHCLYAIHLLYACSPEWNLCHPRHIPGSFYQVYPSHLIWLYDLFSLLQLKTCMFYYLLHTHELHYVKSAGSALFDCNLVIVLFSFSSRLLLFLWRRRMFSFSSCPSLSLLQVDLCLPLFWFVVFLSILCLMSLDYSVF